MVVIVRRAVQTETGKIDGSMMIKKKYELSASRIRGIIHEVT